MTPTDKGYIPFRSYKTYFEVYGKKSDQKPPLLVLHGGPGGAHNYLLGLAKLVKSGRQVIFYDQLGSGLSDRPDDDLLWTIETFIEELEAVRKHLHLDTIDILGHSWGGMLAASYLLTLPKGVRKAILASAMLNMPLYQAEVEKLKRDLPPEVYIQLKKHEAAGTTDSREYQDAHREYDLRHIYRPGKTVFPKEYQRAEGITYGYLSYYTLWGVSEAYANGTLKDWSLFDRLHEIALPVLITSGQYDELTPEQALQTYERIANAKIRIFTAASHSAHVELEEEYLQTITDFLDGGERK